MKTGSTTTPQRKPKVLRKKWQRENARRTRDAHWRMMERAAEHNPLWFCVWNKKRLPELADEERHGLLDGLEMLAWTDQHPDWFIKGEWSDERYAFPLYLTEAGRQALTEREKYDMELVHGGLVEPGFVVTPIPRRAA